MLAGGPTIAALAHLPISVPWASALVVSVLRFPSRRPAPDSAAERRPLTAAAEPTSAGRVQMGRLATSANPGDVTHRRSSARDASRSSAGGALARGEALDDLDQLRGLEGLHQERGESRRLAADAIGLLAVTGQRHQDGHAA